MKRIAAALFGLGALGTGDVSASTAPPLTEDEAVAAFIEFVGVEHLAHVTCGQASPDLPQDFACYGVDYGDNDSATENDVRIVFAILGRHVETGEIVFSAIHAPAWGEQIYEYAAAPSSAATVTTAAGTPTAAVADGAGTTYGDGRFQVGTDITPGLYETTVTLEDPLCLVTVYVTPTENDVLAGTAISTPGTHYFDVPANAHSIEFKSIDDACIWSPSS